MIVNLLAAIVVGGVNLLLLHIKQVYDLDIFANAFTQGAALCILSIALAKSISDLFGEIRFSWFMWTKKSK